ncbi:HAD family hydrolase [Sphingomonas pokkalii]|uniref:HAD family hydrolase n=1 Tax=Sphingomonas pokkalii TaxID=2175090 RepID=A0A2U0SCS7_9SPHN|nr:HAD family hydrolase [Sphingomonas pokkalii]PVX29172.1 hypothetical protein DD559_07370 [Sphingomonas pokkalii]
MMGLDAKPIRSVLITDVDNTLFDWVHVWHSAFSAMLAELLRLSALDEAVLLAEIRKVHQRAGTSEYSFLIGELEVLRGPAGDTPVLDFYAPAIDAFRAARQQTLEFYPGVLATLEELSRRGTLLICYTESLAYYSQYRFRKLGLDRLVDYLYSPPDHDLPDGLSRENIRFHEAAHYTLARTDHRFTPPGELKPKPRNLRSIAEVVVVNRYHQWFRYRSSFYITRFLKQWKLDYVHDGTSTVPWVETVLPNY